MTTGRKFTTEALVAKIIAALTDEWQRASVIIEKVYGPGLDDYERRALIQSMAYHFRNLSNGKQIECDRRLIESRRVNFYRRTPSEGAPK